MNIQFFEPDISPDGRLASYRAYDAQTGTVLGVGYSNHGALLSILHDVADAAEREGMMKLAERIRDIHSRRTPT